MTTLRRATVLSNVRDTIELSARKPAHKRPRRRVNEKRFAAESVSQLAEMAWDRINNQRDGLDPIYRPVIELSIPQKFRIRITIPEELITAIAEGQMQRGEECVMGIPRKVTVGFLMLLTLAVYTSLKTCKMLVGCSIEDFATENVRCFEKECSETLIDAELVLCGFLFESNEAVRLMQKLVIRNFKTTLTACNQRLWLGESLTDVFPMDIYDQHASSRLPYVQEHFPLEIMYFVKEEQRIFIGEIPSIEDLDSAESYEVILRDALWTMDKETADKATIVDTKLLKSITAPIEAPVLDVQKEDLLRLLVREYGPGRKSTFFISRTPNKVMWKAIVRGNPWDCHICGNEHREGTFLVVKPDGRVFVACKYMPKGQKNRFIGLLRREKDATLLKIEAKISLFMGELMGVAVKDLPFDLATYNGGKSFFGNIWMDMTCPLCRKTHTRGETVFITHSAETGAFFLRCRTAKDSKKPFLLLGHLKTREERRLAGLEDEECVKSRMEFGTPLPAWMSQRKREFFLSIFNDESARFEHETYESRYVKALGLSGELGVGTLIVQSVCGTGKTYNVLLLLLQDRLKDKKLYHELLSGYVTLNPVHSARRVTSRLDGKSRKDAAFLSLEFRKALDTDDWVGLDAKRRHAHPEKAKKTEQVAPVTKKPEVEFIDYSEYADEVENLYEKDRREDHEEGYINYFTDHTSPEVPLVQDNSLLFGENAVDPFVGHSHNAALFDILQGDGYVEPETLEKISKALDAIHPDIEPTVMWLSTRRTYARDIYAKYRDLLPGFTLYLDEDGVIDQERLIISIESLVKCVGDTKFDYVILDEISSVLEQLYSPHVRNIEDTRQKFCDLITNAKTVVCMDANITSETLYWLTRLREGNIRFIKNTFKRKTGHTAIYYEKLDNLVLKLKESLKRGERVHVVSTSKKRADELAKLFAEYKPLLVTSETNTKETKEVLERINESIYDYGLLIHTSTISVGTDIWVKYSSSCYLIADPTIVNSRICLQMVNRVRVVQNEVLHWHVRNYRQDRPLELPDIYATCKESFISSSELRHVITRESQITMDMDDVLDLNDPWVVSYLFRVQSENLKLTCLKEMLHWRLQEEGYTMVTFKEETSELDSSRRAAMKESQVAAAAEVEKEIVQKLGTAKWVNLDEETDNAVSLDDEWVNGTERTTFEDRRCHYTLLEHESKSGDIKESDRWVYKKSWIMNLVQPKWRAKLHKDGKRLRELEKGYKRFRKMKRLESIDQLIKNETERFERNPSIDMVQRDDNLRLAVVVYISQLLGLSGPSEEKEVSRVSKRLTKEEKMGKSVTEVRMAEGSLDACVDWITLHQRFISSVFGLNWGKSFDELRPSLRNRGIQSLFAFGIGNRLDFKSKRRTEGGRVNVIQNKCKLNELKLYFS